MTDVKFKMLDSVLTIPSDLETFKKKKQAVWTGSSWRRKGTFSPNYGDTGSWSDTQIRSIQRQNSMYLPERSSGLRITDTTGSVGTGNYELYGDGRWMPASFFYGIGFEVYQSRGSGSGMYLWKYALVFAHKTSSSYRIWGIDTGARGPSQGYRYIHLLGDTTAPQTIRQWGKDWLFQGIMLHIANKSGPTTQSEIEVYNMKLGHVSTVSSSTIKIMPPTMRPYSNRAVTGTVGFTDPYTPK